MIIIIAGEDSHVNVQGCRSEFVSGSSSFEVLMCGFPFTIGVHLRIWHVYLAALTMQRSTTVVWLKQLWEMQLRWVVAKKMESSF